MWIVEDEQAVTKALEKISANRHNKSLIFQGGWTRASLECYKARLMCHRCPNYEVCESIEEYEHKKPMKQKTIELVRKYGRPPERINEEWKRY